MGMRNILHGTVLKATPDRIQLRWRGQTLEAVNSPSRAYLPPPGSPLAFFIRPEYVRLIRKDRGAPDPSHHMNLMSGTVVSQTDFGTTWTLVSQTSFRMQQISRQNAQLQQSYGELKLQVARLSAPGRIAQEARRLGLLLPNGGSVHLLEVAGARGGQPEPVAQPAAFALKPLLGDQP